MLDAGYWILDTGYWMLDAGCWILDVGSWKLDAGMPENREALLPDFEVFYLSGFLAFRPPGFPASSIFNFSFLDIPQHAS